MGGAAGLVAAKRFLEEGWNVCVFEQGDQIGGTWIYTEEIGTEEKHIHTSMYANLTTNLPKEVMAYLDYPFPGHCNSILTREEVLFYLQSYAEEFNLHKCIKFQHKVLSVDPCNPKEPLTGKYNVTYMHNNEKETEQFDFVAVCNGHYSFPYIPTIPGIENFRKNILHSHDYRTPEIFAGQRVLIIGSGFSANDIGQQLLPHIPILHVSLRENHYGKGTTLGKLQYHGQTKEILENGDIVLDDGEILKDIDTIMFCTGYHYKFDFLPKSLRIDVKFKRVCDLYKHVLPVNCWHPQFYRFYDRQRSKTLPPTIAFIGLPMGIVPFPLFDHQVHFVRAIWSKRVNLPSVSEMRTEIKKDLENRKAKNLPEHIQHRLIQGQNSYTKELVAIYSGEGASPTICQNVNETVSLLGWNSGVFLLATIVPVI